MKAILGNDIDRFTQQRFQFLDKSRGEPGTCSFSHLYKQVKWLEAAPRAQVAHRGVGVMVSLNDMAIRPPRALQDGEVLDLGGKRVRHIDTPHVPHGWEARVLFEESTRTLLCGDLLSHTGDGPALTSEDILEQAKRAEEMFHSSCITATTGATIRKLAELSPKTLAIMHGSSINGDAVRALHGMADLYDGWFRQASMV